MRRSLIERSNSSVPPSPSIRSCTGGGFGLPSFKPFKPPQPSPASSTRPQPIRKRKKVDYKENTEDHSDSDDDPRARRAKKAKLDAAAAAQLPQPVFPVYTVKPSLSTLQSSFSIPTMKDSSGNIVKTDLSNVALGVKRQPVAIPRPLHDPLADHAIVLFDPTIEEVDVPKLPTAEASQAPVDRGPHRSLADMLGLTKLKERKEVQVPVVIDPRLGKVLRPHQLEGVKFLYRCATGKVEEGAMGCIMADEMGLGKTLQCISLLWTLLKQSPRPGRPTIEKAIVVCPSSLIKNWANEFDKWLGKGAIHSLAVDGKMNKGELVQTIRQWCVARGRAVTQPVIIVSYEGLRNLAKEIGNAEVGLLLCDEGHRLKNCENQTWIECNTINARRRVLLTGTPVQNDLTEYYSLLSFVIPGSLGTRAEFRKKFELPILRGRDADATEKDREASERCLKELGQLVNKFIIRRTNQLLTKYLPVKYEHVVFCALSPFQRSLYQLFCTSPEVKKLLKGTESKPLKAVDMLKKLVNHPDLVSLPDALEGSEKHFPEGYNPQDLRRPLDPSLSGKFTVLERFLDKIKHETKDKVVLISNFTQTLDLFEKMLRDKKYGFFRLDGTMAVPKRQKIVDQFNDPESPQFVFLLSSKAGGCGINLIGANRLVLFDPDWNPATDQQALARVWRDGQKKECFVYRFISTGTIEEKVFQRQSHKQSLSTCVVDEGEDVLRHFSRDNLRQLFELNEGTISDTHDKFKCKRCKDGKQLTKAPALLYGDTSTWNHLNNAALRDIHDDLLRAETGLDGVTSVFQYITTN